VIDLDDGPSLRAGDPGGMLSTVAAFPEHCREGYRLGKEAAPLPDVLDVRSIAFCGMGGSAVAGDVIRALYADRLPVPVVVVRSSELPEFCGPHSLVVASSYSGGTAEALACFDEAVKRGCRVIAISSGGELTARAEELGLARVGLPAGFMPRAALGYILLGALGALEVVGFLPPLGADVEAASAELTALASTYAPSVPTSANQAKHLARAIQDRTPVVWGGEGIGSVAAGRWKTQFNENAKVPAWASSVPELDHNEVVGWSQGMGSPYFLLALRHEGEPPDVAARFPPSLDLAREAGAVAEEVWASGGSPLSRFLSLSLIGDFTTSYLGIARGVDPTPIEAIARLKQALAEA
jgi:glucose/mannose-6-phosphate isomerase